MDLLGTIESSRKRISQAKESITQLVEDGEDEIIQEKERLEEKIEQLPVRGREWKKFSKLLDQENPEKASEAAKRKFDWSQKTEMEVAKIYVNIIYLKAELMLSKSQKAVYNAAKLMSELEAYINEGGEDRSRIAKEFNDAYSSLEKAQEEIIEAEREFDRSKTASEYFKVSEHLADEARKKEATVDKTRKEIKSVTAHVKEMRNRITN